jgi:excisionase family DNA binding protein
MKSLIQKENTRDADSTLTRRLLRKQEIAKQLCVSQRTIGNWTRQKRIPVHRFSSRLIRYDLQKVQRALDRYEIREVGRNSNDK